MLEIRIKESMNRASGASGLLVINVLVTEHRCLVIEHRCQLKGYDDVLKIHQAIHLEFWYL